MLRLFSAIARDRYSWFFIALLCCVFAWGHHGKLDWVGAFYPGWIGLGNAHGSAAGAGLFGLKWDQQLIGFLLGFVFAVAVPAALVRWLLSARLSQFGFGWPPAGERRAVLLQLAAIAVLTVPGFYLAATFASVRDFYPYYRGDPATPDFLAYEIASSLFYVSIEALFRGFILFGLIRWLHQLLPADSQRDKFRIAGFAIVVSLLPYAIWHLDKAPAEVWGTLFWGLAAGASAVSTRTIWHLVLLHWLLNVFMDYLILLDL